MPTDLPEDDPYADEPDRWEAADRAWREKWSDAPEDEVDEPLEPPPPTYRPAKTTMSGTSDAYGAGMREAGPHLGLGLQIGASMAFFTGLGIVVDRWLDTSPWGVIVGASLGMVGILFLVIRIANEGSSTSKQPGKDVRKNPGA